ncbi:Fic family protein [Candidatus Gottesmanbacteria bacterium]|nr:Fic family protein [Candidatus Gottesmanbacteria bacterium]
MPISAKFDTRINQLSPESISRILSHIAKIDELKGQWIAGAKLHPQVLGSLKQSVLITSTGASTRIEGARLSDEDIEKLMHGISIQKFRDRDVQEVKGYYELLVHVFDSWKSLHLNEGLIKSFHKELLKYGDKDVFHMGEYKKKENKVVMIDEAGQSIGGLFDTTAAHLTPSAMQDLVGWTQSALVKKIQHPLLIIGSFFIEFLKIHPFEDGNGRLSRILTNMLLLQAGYTYIPYVSHEKLIEDNKPDYYMALRKSQNTFGTDHESIEAWLSFFLEILLQQSELAVALITDERIEKILSKNQLAVWQYVQSKGETVIGDIVRNTGVSRPTVKQALVKLKDLEKIEMLGVGRGARYRKIIELRVLQ